MEMQLKFGQRLFCVTVVALIVVLSPARASLLGSVLSMRRRSRTGSNSLVDGYDDRDGSIVDLCQCSCCYEVAPGKQHCVESPKMEYEVRACGQCDVQGCWFKFNPVCSDVSVVNATCIKRKGWVFETIPLLFLCTTAVLILYGVTTKRPAGGARSANADPSLTRVNQMDGQFTGVSSLRTFGTFDTNSIPNSNTST
jgi:hypothetical protein